MFLRRLSFGLVFCLLFSGIAAESANGDPIEPIEQLEHLEAPLPQAVRHLMIRRPRVVFEVAVNSHGELSDALAVEASHVGLLERAYHKLKEASFRPAKQNGQPIFARTRVVVQFVDPDRRARSPLGDTFAAETSLPDHIGRTLHQMDEGRWRYEESHPRELDETLQVLDSRMVLLKGEDGNVASGQAVVRYAVDHRGRVRLPQILKSASPELSQSVLLTLKNMRFAPPIKSGRATFVYVTQPFNVAPPDSSVTDSE